MPRRMQDAKRQIAFSQRQNIAVTEVFSAFNCQIATAEAGKVQLRPGEIFFPLLVDHHGKAERIPQSLYAAEMVKMAVRQKDCLDGPSMLQNQFNQFFSLCAGVYEKTVVCFVVNVKVAICLKYTTDRQCVDHARSPAECAAVGSAVHSFRLRWSALLLFQQLLKHLFHALHGQGARDRVAAAEHEKGHATDAIAMCFAFI